MEVWQDLLRYQSNQLRINLTVSLPAFYVKLPMAYFDVDFGKVKKIFFLVLVKHLSSICS